MRHIISFLIATLLIPALSPAQRWKKMRYEYVMGVGASNFLGELGGANQLGTNYFRDLEITMTRPTVSVGMRYKIGQYFSCRGTLTYGQIAGNDRLTNEFHRNYRNLSFRSPVVELSVGVEPSLYKEQLGHRYRIRGIKGRKWAFLYPYPVLGLSLYWFNPKARYNGKWYSLQPLTTEGQGIFPTRKKYNRLQVSIPVGIGIRYQYSKRWSVGLEYRIAKTFTDYLDDVSTTYIHRDYLLAAYGGEEGDIAATLADRSDGTLPEKTLPGQQRGDPTDKDTYMFALVTFNYKFMLKYRRRHRPKF